MKARHSNIVVSSINRQELSPHLSTTVRKNEPQMTTSLESLDADPTLSFRALSLQQPPPSQISAEDTFSRSYKYRSMPADFNIFSSPQSPESIDDDSIEVPKGLMVRTVSLEPKTQFTAKRTTRTTISTCSTFPHEKVRQKRGRHLSCDSLPCNEIARHTQKRRRLASRNRALTSNDFDSILSQLGPMDGCL
jgi:hypothetical protein